MQKSLSFSMNYQKKSHNIMLVRILLIIAVVVLLAFIILTRFSDINADPDVSISLLKGAYINDEGWKSGNAINKFLNDRWMCNDKNDILIWPVMPMLEYVSFKIFGISLFSLRFPSVVLSTLLILLLGIYIFYNCQKLDINKKLIILIVYLILSGTSYYLFIQGRIAFFDIPMSTFGFMSLLALDRALRSEERKRKYVYFILYGILTGLSMAVKTTGLIFFITGLIILILRIIIGRLDKKYNVRGFVFSFIVMISVTTFLLLLVNKVITSSYFTTPWKYIFTPGVVCADQLRPFIVMKNYLRFFTNYLILNNAALFLIGIVGLIFILNNSLLHKKIRISDEIMLALAISSFLFLGFFTPQAERYFVVLFIPLFYFISRFIRYVFLISLKSVFIRKQPILRHSVLFLIFLVLFSNAWNMWKMENYLKKKQFSLQETAIAISKDIEEDSSLHSIQTPHMMVGRKSSTLAVINHLPFTYHAEDGANNYYIITYKIEDITSDTFTLISHYKLFDSDYPEFTIYLARKNVPDE